MPMLSLLLLQCLIRVIFFLCRLLKSYTHHLLVVYQNKEVTISNPTEFPEVSDSGQRVKEIQEPVVKASIIVPEGIKNYLSYKELLTSLNC